MVFCALPQHPFAIDSSGFIFEIQVVRLFISTLKRIKINACFFFNIIIICNRMRQWTILKSDRMHVHKSVTLIGSGHIIRTLVGCQVRVNRNVHYSDRWMTDVDNNHAPFNYYTRLPPTADYYCIERMTIIHYA